MSVCGQFKRTASVPGSQPIFNESVEFSLRKLILVLYQDQLEYLRLQRNQHDSGTIQVLSTEHRQEWFVDHLMWWSKWSIIQFASRLPSLYINASFSKSDHRVFRRYDYWNFLQMILLYNRDAISSGPLHSVSLYHVMLTWSAYTLQHPSIISCRTMWQEFTTKATLEQHTYVRIWKTLVAINAIVKLL